MTEDRVGFLCNMAFNLSQNNETHKVLRSYYLMRCNEVTKGYGLPPKFFSSIARCSHCFLDWAKDSDVKVKPLTLNRRQRRRIMSHKKPDHNKNNYEDRRCLLQNEIVQVCTFCKQSTTTQLIKPERPYKSTTTKEHKMLKANDQINQEKKNSLNKQGVKKITNLKSDKKSNVVNLYSNAFDVFSLKNNKNTLSSTIKVLPKVIKNNKKRKDKFAGLCQIAVLASAKLKEQHKEKQTQEPSQNKLNLFLKPSSG